MCSGEDQPQIEIHLQTRFLNQVKEQIDLGVIVSCSWWQSEKKTLQIL